MGRARAGEEGRAKPEKLRAERPERREEGQGPEKGRRCLGGSPAKEEGRGPRSCGLRDPSGEKKGEARRREERKG